ncbi:MAG: polyisoprenoid-binding protein [candidate division Zixibacteria bacterium]|nr:polyisoprenoid-binding protein [candidate division Zixibacteria bacterium]
MFKKLFLTGIALLLIAVTAHADTYQIDATHSSVTFAVTHMGLSKVKGEFKQFEGTVDYDPGDVSKSKVNATIQVSSIDTHAEKRDAHLKSGDFFAADSFPTMTFKSTKVTDKGNGQLEIQGDLTLRGTTKPVTLAASLIGSMDDPMGGKRVGFSAHTKINRMDYGVKWSRLLDTGGLVVGNDVDIQIEIEAVVKKDK